MITDLAGRLHPALVHLPIGILLLAGCFELVSSHRRLTAIRPTIPLMLFWGMIAAIFSCISGLAIEAGGDYEEEVTNPHKWSGIALAVISIVMYLLYRTKRKTVVIKSAAALLVLMIFVTGHLGGSITHGEDFITAGLTGNSNEVKIKPIPNIQDAVLYTDVVQPLLEARCYNCHSSRKQKGKLRLDEHDLIVKGGESGNTLIPGKPDESELIERLLLPLDDDDHMPPKGKPQLSKEQIAILQWWVGTGADFHKKVSQLDQTESIKPALLALQAGTTEKIDEAETSLPAEKVAAADSAVVTKLSNAGVMIIPVARGSNYVGATFITAEKNVEASLSMLEGLKKQLLWLKLDGQALKDSSIQKIAKLVSLRRLHLTNTEMPDESVALLANLKELTSLNLTGTSVTASGIIKLKTLPRLKNLYLYKTSITASEREELKKQFPAVNIDFGNYTLPMLATDTTEVKISP